MKTLLGVESFWKTARLETDGENAHGNKRFHTLCLNLVSDAISALSACGISVFIEEITLICGCAFLLVSVEEMSSSILSDTVP